MLEESELTRIRSIAHAVIGEANREERTRSLVQVRRIPQGARINVSLQEGTPRPADPLTYLGGLCDRIVSELRLERDTLGRPAFQTEEATFTSGDSPVFSFEVKPK